MPKVAIYTQAYNPGEYLIPCIESVLGQTYTDFEWILIDHGSTDETPSVIDRYAEKDKRIIPIHIAVNGSVPNLFLDSLREKGTGKYLAYLDSDDWWDLDYLEHLVPFAEENNLDLALTGAVQFFQKQGETRVMRKVRRPIVLTLEEFARNFSVAGPFAGSLWASLRSLEKVLAMEGNPKDREVQEKGLIWRNDTLHMLAYIDDCCQRIGINEFTPYHYRIQEKSLSHQYSDSFFRSNIFFHDRLQDFLSRHEAMNEVNRMYLKRRHFFEMQSTLNVLKHSVLAPAEKARVCSQLTSHPLTIDAFTCDCSERRTWWKTLLDILREAASIGAFPPDCAPSNIVRSLIPDCAEMLTSEGVELLDREPQLMDALIADDRYQLSMQLLALIKEKKYSRRICPAALLCRIFPQDSPLQNIKDFRFIERHTELISMVLEGRYRDALDKMTGDLLEGKNLYGKEEYLRLYLTLAALENQPSAFLFGKLRQGELYKEQGRMAECQAVLEELDEMGAGELPEITALRE